MSSRPDRFTEHALGILAFAQEELQRLHHKQVGAEHILLGIAHEEDCATVQTLYNLDVEPQQIKRAVGRVICPSARATVGQMPLTLPTKRTIEFAMEEACLMSASRIDTNHLLALTRSEGTAAIYFAA